MSILHDLAAAARLSQKEILVLSAGQSLGSAVRAIMAAKPKWVVVVREEDWVPDPYLYAFRPEEVLDRVGRDADAGQLRDALNLHETGASAVAPDGAPEPTPTGASPSARRIVTVDSDYVPTGVKEPAKVQDRTRGPREWAIPRSANGGTPAAAADTIEMRLAAHAPSAMSVGSDDIIDVIVAAAADALVIPGAITATGSTTEPIAALLTILGDAVIATGPRILKLDPPKPGTPSQNAFEIRAAKEGTAQAAVMFRQGGSELGNFRHQIRVTAAGVRAERSAAEVSGASRVADDGGVLLLQVEPLHASNEIRYKYRVQCERLGLDFAEYESPPLLSGSGGAAESELAFVRRIYGQMTNRMLRTQNQAKRFQLEVEAFGESLCTQLFPPELVRVLWDGRTKVDAVRVMSWEPYIPWELVKLTVPSEQQSDDQFFGEYGMVRWLAGRGAARTLALKDWSYVAATYPNNPANNVTNEVKYFTTVLPQHGIQPVHVDSTYDAFLEALQNPTFDVMHVACHGDVKEDNIDKAELLISDELVNGRSQYVSISANVLGKVARFATRRPLVFLNACEAGRLGESLTAWGGWPRKLIDAGAGAVVGASWPVRDVASNKFTTAFYDALVAGKPLSTASTEARKAASAVGDATWLAFKVFGDPHAAKST